MERSNTYKFAEKELQILKEYQKDSLVIGFEDEILELCDKFEKSGQSGRSAPYYATFISGLVKKLMLQEPICPITGFDNEWIDVTERGDGSMLQQNNRCSALFKHDKGCYYLDGIVFKCEDNQFTSHGENGVDGILSNQYIKSFPFTPKVFYIDVIMDGEDWKIKDWKQLDKVWKYYQKM